MWDVSRLSFEQFKDNLSPPAPFMPTRHEMYNLTLIKGPFSHDEIARIPAAVGRPTRVFTILRDPVERSLSFFALFWGPHNRPLSTRYEMPFETFFDYNSTQHRDKGAMWHSYVRTFTENSMTWQLGNYLHEDHRDHSLSRTELLNRAKQALREMVYVAFFEDMWRHQGNIMQPGKVFASGDLYTLWVFPWLWWVWSLFAWPRSCVRKFGSLYSPEQLRMVEESNKLDRELYDWAVKEFDPRAKLYNSYAAFCWDNLWLVLAVLSVSLFLLYNLGRFLLFLFRKCKACCLDDAEAADNALNVTV